jgi:adenylate cyclase
MRVQLHDALVELGTSEDDIARAEADGWLPLLVLDRLVRPGRTDLDQNDVALALHVEVDVLHRLWRALGFPDVPDDLHAFGTADVDAAQTLLTGGLTATLDEPSLLQDVRVISAALTRIAAVIADNAADLVEEQHAAGVDDETIATMLLHGVTLADVDHLVVYALHLQLRAALWRRLTIDGVQGIEIAIGFADLSGYTALVEQLDDDALTELVGRWESVAYDTIAQHGARVVKMIGDEVMFVGIAPQLARAALALRDRVVEVHLPAVRCGVAAGPLLSRGGDYYGPVVNLASRLTELADPSVVLVAASLASELAGAGFVLHPDGRHELRDIGETEVFRLDRDG